MDKQQTQYLFVPSKKWKMLTKLLKNSQIGVFQTFGFVYHDTNGQNHGFSMEDPVVPLKRNLYGYPLAGLLWERQCEKILLEKSKLGMTLWSWKRIILVCVCGWHKIGWMEKKNSFDVESSQQRSRFGRTNNFPWIMYTWAALNDNSKWEKIFSTITETCLNREFPRDE